MPTKTTTIALLSSDDLSVTFTVELGGRKNLNPYSLWIALHGYDMGDVHRSASYSGIRWNELNPVPVGATCQVTVPKNADPGHPVVRYEVFVALFPDVWTPVSNTLTF